MIGQARTRIGFSLGPLLAAGGIVIALIGMNWITVHRATGQRHRTECVEQLMMIAAAKEAVVLKKSLKPGATITMDELVAEKSVFSTPSILPSGATDLQIGPVGTLPTCVYAGKIINPIEQSPYLTSYLAQKAD